MNKVFLLTALFCFMIQGSQAQTYIKGKVTNQEGHALPDVSITIAKTSVPSVISYAITNRSGNFSLTINIKNDSLKLKVSCVGFESTEMVIKNINSEFEIKLDYRFKLLNDIVIKGSPIYMKKDTLSYTTGSFTSKEDRVIADVIKKLPGVELLSDGKVLYQGKPIQKFYVDGLDLMEGSYNLVNNNLPAAAVSKIQIIENDQPIKILDSLVFSDKASLNLQLKKVTFTGTAKLGAGIHPLLWDVNLTPMLFTKKVQTINSYQTNNTGRNISNDIEVLTSDGFSDQSAKFLLPFLSIDQIFTPSIDNKYWLRNNTHLITFNVLKKISKETQIKGNVSLLNDNQVQSGDNQISFVTPAEIITLQQAQHAFINKNLLRINLIAEKNAADAYLKNTTQFRYQTNAGVSGLLTNNQPSGQLLKTDIWEVRNRISGIKKIGSQLVSLNSSISYLRSPQLLTLKPLVFDTVFGNKEVKEARQSVILSNFYTDNNFGFTKKLRGMTLMPKLGVSFHHQQLSSFVDTIYNSNPFALSQEFRNNLSFTHATQYVESSLQYNTAFWKSGLNLPVRRRQFEFNNNLLNTSERLNKLTFEPSAYLVYKKIRFAELVYNFVVNNSFGTIIDGYTGYIIRNSRTFMRHSGFLPQGRSHSNGLTINYRNPLSYLFLSVGYTFTLYRRNMIVSNFIDSQGMATVENVYEVNKQSGHFISVSGSKFFKGLKILLKVNTSVNLRSQWVNLNNSRRLLKNEFYNSQITVGYNSNKYISVNYSNSIGIASGNLSGEKLKSTLMQQHNLDVSVFLPVNHTITTSANYYSNSFSDRNRQILMNLLYRYTIPKSKIDIELTCNNLLDEKYFTTYNNEIFYNVFNSFSLRPRQMVAGIRFSF
ncbi:carboxypeptidase-like regulatory domain-containing protein [Ferruginibacter sp.]|nr:carboxypeptidase-like regulatory domain-containing protein [Ferruginibacter sp.]